MIIMIMMIIIQKFITRTYSHALSMNRMRGAHKAQSNQTERQHILQRLIHKMFLHITSVSYMLIDVMNTLINHTNIRRIFIKRGKTIKQPAISLSVDNRRPNKSTG